LNPNTDSVKSVDNAVSLLEYFDCSYNKITSFNKLKLPDSIVDFRCSDNQITSFNKLKLPSSLLHFDCSCNKIKVIKNFVFPPNLMRLNIDLEVRFVNPKFNSVLEHKLKNKIKYDNRVISTHDELIFAYLNFDMNYQQYELLIKKLSSE
jgi:Leucine-rich repeat (LRR) protein